MRIDARGRELRELFKELKDILALHCGKEVFIEVMVGSDSAVKKVRVFASMSGCQAVAEENDGYCVVRITGSPCCI